MGFGSVFGGGCVGGVGGGVGGGGPGDRVGGGGGDCLGFGTRDRWRARAASGGILPAWGIRGHVALSEGRTEGSLGAASKGLRGSFRLDLRDAWHFEGRSKGVSKEILKGGSRAGFRHT